MSRGQVDDLMLYVGRRARDSGDERPRKGWGMVELTPEQDRFLREHNLCVLATGRKDGSPQVSTVYYHFDGNDIVISATTDRAKYVNAMRQPRVAVLVNDGRRQCVVYGRAEGVPDDPERLQLTRRVREHRGAAVPDDATLAAELTRDRRAMLRIVPEVVRLND